MSHQYQEFIDFLNTHFTNLCFRGEYKFNKPNSKHSLDVALVCCKIGIEIEGGVWIKGRHTSGAGFTNDMKKYNLAWSQGWRIVRFTPGQVKNLTKATFLPIIEAYFRNFPCQHSELNSRLRVVFDA